MQPQPTTAVNAVLPQHHQSVLSPPVQEETVDLDEEEMETEQMLDGDHSTDHEEHPVTIESLSRMIDSDDDLDDDSDEDDSDDDSCAKQQQEADDPLGHSCAEARQSCDGADEPKKKKPAWSKKQRCKTSRKSMAFKSEDERTKKLKALELDMGRAMKEFVTTKCQSPSDRRPFLAAIAEKHQRKTVCHYLDLHIPYNEWWRIRVHSKYPGPFNPVEKEQIHRMRVDQELLHKLLQFLDEPGNIQRCAYGSQLRELLCGEETVEMDNVSRLKKIDKLTEDFINGLCSEMEASMAGNHSATECRCQSQERATFRRCMQDRGHEGKCKFTPKTSISATTVRALIASLTAGDIKSLSGLDDVRVLKGKDNFEALRVIAKGLLGPGEAKAMVKRVDDTELFYQTDYVPHLQVVGEYGCNCLTCGFFNPGEFLELFALVLRASLAACSCTFRLR
jgi:hypothetical protein